MDYVSPKVAEAAQSTRTPEDVRRARRNSALRNRFLHDDGSSIWNCGVEEIADWLSASAEDVEITENDEGEQIVTVCGKRVGIWERM